MLCKNVQPQSQCNLSDPDAPFLFIVYLVWGHMCGSWLGCPWCSARTLCSWMSSLGSWHVLETTIRHMHIPSHPVSPPSYSAWEELTFCPGRVIVLSWLNKTHYPFSKLSPCSILGLNNFENKNRANCWKGAIEKGRNSSWEKKINKHRLGFLKMLCCYTVHKLLHFFSFIS